MYIAFMIILVFFAIIGISAFILSLMRLFLYRNKDGAFMLIIPSLSDDTAEMKLRAAVNRCQRAGSGEVVCLLDGCEDESQKILECIARDYPCVEILTKEELKEKLGLT